MAQYLPFCCRCGKELTDDNCRSVPLEWSLLGNSPYCIDCEEEYYNQLAAVEGKSIALFHACLAFNTPCRPFVLKNADIENAENPWRTYNECLLAANDEQGKYEAEGFFDGITDMTRIFGREMSQKDFAAYIKYESTKLEKKAGTATQRRVWGYYGEETDEYYNELDNIYNSRLASFKGQTVTAQMDYTLRNVALLQFKMNEATRANRFKTAKDIYAVISSMLSDEQMRKKDEKPVEKFQIDSQIVALENAGLVEDGKFLPLRKLQEQLYHIHFEGQKYDYPVDAADQLILNILNNIRQNSDLPLVSELDDDMEVDDKLGEFAKEADEHYKENIRYTGLTPVVFKPKEEIQKEEESVDDYIEEPPKEKKRGRKKKGEE